MKKVFTLLLLVLAQLSIAQHVPSFEEVISLRGVGSAVMSADGRNIAFTVQTTDWNDNRYDTEIWLIKQGKTAFQLSNTAKGSSTSPSFSPDGQWIAFLADRGNKNQIHVIRLDGGEAKVITKEEEGISSFEWHPSGKTLLFLKPEKEDKRKEREKRYGAFEADDKEYVNTHLWEVEFQADAPDPSEKPCYETIDSLKQKTGCIQLPKARRLTDGKFTIVDFIPSPDGTSIAFTRQPDPLINTSVKSDISIVNISTGVITALIQNKSADNIEDWSPDSKEILFSTHLDDTLSHFYKNQKLYAVKIDTKELRPIAPDVDENLGTLVWRPSGIFGTGWSRTKRHVYKVDPKSGKSVVFLANPEQVLGISLSKAGDKMVCTARNGDQLTEVFQVNNMLSPQSERVTDLSAQIRNWKVAQSEVIRWKSKDGVEIEGVLHKPKNYDPEKKYPLLVVIHGGPTGIDTPAPVPGSVYPIVQWLDKGCLVLRPNYRGSAGYGEAFRSLNLRNLGVGDAWDVLSGVDYLDSKGLIDRSRMGCMGWSQGGYISAFLTTNSDAFKAISVGAGISNWMTYYVNTDIHPFTRQYLKATPWSDEDIYRQTSPMTNIRKAKTPTLIQHGEFDRRVPIANAYELLQGLRDNGIPSELVVYKGFGHGITKPKERLAALWHNWQWFGKYIWGENIELPTGEKPNKN